MNVSIKNHSFNCYELKTYLYGRSFLVNQYKKEFNENLKLSSYHKFSGLNF